MHDHKLKPLTNEQLQDQERQRELLDEERISRSRVLTELVILLETPTIQSWDTLSVAREKYVPILYRSLFAVAKHAARAIEVGDIKAMAISEAVTAGLTWDESHPTATMKQLIEFVRRRVFVLARHFGKWNQPPSQGEYDPMDPSGDCTQDWDNTEPSESNEDKIIARIDAERQMMRIYRTLDREDFGFLWTYNASPRSHTAQERKRMQRLRDRVKRRLKNKCHTNPPETLSV